MRESEYSIYSERLIAGYRRFGRLCPALESCREVLPAGSSLSVSIEECLKKLLTGNGAEEIHPVREALRSLENGDVRLTILHDVIANGEETGCEIGGVLVFLKEMWELVPAGRAGGDKRNKAREKRGFSYYQRLRQGADGHRRDRWVRRAVGEIAEELPVWMMAVTSYAWTGSFSEAVRRSSALTHGFFRKELRTLARCADHGEPDGLCRSFLTELAVPEIPLCLMVALRLSEGADEDAEMVLSACRRWHERAGVFTSGGSGGFHAGGKGVGIAGIPGMGNRFARKGVMAAVLTAVWVLIMIGMTGLADAKKEQHLREALTGAMSVTVGETPGITETNQMLAIFMQNMLLCVDDDIDLTVRICEMNEKEKTMDVEAVGEYDLGFGRRRVSVLRRVAFG